MMVVGLGGAGSGGLRYRYQSRSKSETQDPRWTARVRDGQGTVRRGPRLGGARAARVGPYDMRRLAGRASLCAACGAEAEAEEKGGLCLCLCGKATCRSVRSRSEAAVRRCGEGNAHQAQHGR